MLKQGQGPEAQSEPEATEEQWGFPCTGGPWDWGENSCEGADASEQQEPGQPS